MKFGIVPINIGIQSPDQSIGLAQLAEGSGFESVWTFEHVVVPIDYKSKYPYNESGKMGAEPNTNFIDPLIALAAIAAQTKTIRLGTGVNILSQANPLLMAKQIASLDFMSGGRFLFGAGIGWLKEEFRAMGTPYEKRGARFDDYIQAMKKVWSGETVEHQSEFLDWTGFQSFPLPVQKPHVPVIMGGNAGKILERIAKYGDGWFAPIGDPNELKPRLDELRQVCEGLGRNYDEIEITCMWSPNAGEDLVKAMADLGVARLVAPLPALGADVPGAIGKIGQELIPKFA